MSIFRKPKPAPIAPPAPTRVTLEHPTPRMIQCDACGVDIWRWVDDGRGWGTTRDAHYFRIGPMSAIYNVPCRECWDALSYSERRAYVHRYYGDASNWQQIERALRADNMLRGAFRYRTLAPRRADPALQVPPWIREAA